MREHTFGWTIDEYANCYLDAQRERSDHQATLLGSFIFSLITVCVLPDTPANLSRSLALFRIIKECESSPTEQP